jgi:predicted  nucleic acid-binding Zn-ribbon protein
MNEHLSEIGTLKGRVEGLEEEKRLLKEQYIHQEKQLCTVQNEKEKEELRLEQSRKESQKDREHMTQHTNDIRIQQQKQLDDY